MNNDLELEIYSALIGLTGDYNLPSTKNPVTHYIDEVLSKYNLTPDEAIHILIRKRGTHSQETYNNLTTQIINYLKELNNLKPEFKLGKITTYYVNVNKQEKDFRDRIELELQDIKSIENKIEYLEDKLIEYKTKIITPEAQSASGMILQAQHPVEGALFTDRYILELIAGLKSQLVKDYKNNNPNIVNFNFDKDEIKALKEVFSTLQTGKLVDGDFNYFKQALISGKTNNYINWIGSVPSLNLFLKELFNYKKHKKVNWKWSVQVFILNPRISPEELRNNRKASTEDRATIKKAITRLGGWKSN